MGRNKLLLELDGETIVRRAVSRVAAAGLAPLIVVLGYEAEQTRRELAEIACSIVINPDYQRGMGSSVRAGIKAVPTSASAAMVVLADMPLVTSAMLAVLAQRYRGSIAPLVISDYGGVNAPPMLYDRSLFGELEAMRREGCAREVAQRHRAEAAIVSWPAGALADLDRPEEYERIKAQLEAG